jgi:LuxR family maltose regulon positive regulatory protein
VWPKRLTLVVAGAGYGKTVLFTQWAARQRGRRAVRWVTLAQAHNDRHRLPGDVWQSLAPPDAERATALPRPGDGAALVDALAALQRVRPTTLVLDGLDTLTDATALETCATLVDDGPSWLSVVLIGRAEPSVPSYRAGLSDELVELGPRDLAFSPEEAADLLQRCGASSMGRSEAEGLVEWSEGWPAGLEIAARAVRAAPERPLAEALERAAPDVARYIGGEVLAPLAPSEVRFLCETSVLDAMSGPLCDYVVGEHHSQAVLEALAHRSVFTARGTADGEWFRYHRLFRSVLRQRLAEGGAAREELLLRRAADWYLERRDYDAAIDYLAQAGAWDDLIREVRLRSPAILEHQRFAQVVQWVRRIGPDAKAGRTDILLLEATAMALSGLTDGLGETLAAVAADGSLSPADRVVADLVGCYGQLSAGPGADALAAADRVLLATKSLGEFDVPRWLGLVATVSDVVAAALIARGICHLYECRIAEAKQDLRQVPERAHAPWRATALGLLGIANALRGRPTSAEDLVNRADAIAASFDIRASTLAVARLAAALVAAERDEFEQGSEALALAAASLADERWPALEAWILTERAHLALCSGAAGTALALLSEVTGDPSPPPLLVRARRAVVEAQAHLALGDLGRAAAALEPVRDAETSEVYGARARVAIEGGDIDGARALVRRWPDDPEPRARLERCLWSAVVHSVEGDRASALAVLGAVVAECEIENMLGLFRDGGPSVLGLARALYGVAPTAFLRQIVERRVAVARPVRTRALVVPLTDKEYTVLSLLPTRMSNTEIAQRLGISHNTVKTHLKHIYRKFNAVRRSEVISVAEQLHML